MKNKIVSFNFFLLLSLFIFFNINIHSKESFLNAEKEKFIVINDNTKLFTKTLGKKDALLIIHGGPGMSYKYLYDGLKDLANNHFLIFYDQRGCGQSTSIIDDQNIDILTYLEDIDTILKAYNLKKISILGHSWGAYLALNYALKNQKKITKLILSNPGTCSSKDYFLLEKNFQNRVSIYFDDIEKIQKSNDYINGNTKAFDKYYQTIFQGYCFEKEMAKNICVEMSKESFFAGLKINSILENKIFSKPHDLYPSLTNLKIPTLIIHGNYDIIPIESINNLHHALINSKLAIIDKSGHFPFIEKKETFIKLIGDFLKK